MDKSLLSLDINCKSMMASGLSFCKFTDWERQCIAGLPGGTSRGQDKNAPAQYIALPLRPLVKASDFYEEDMARCFVHIERSLYCGDSPGLPLVLKDVSNRFCMQAGFEIDQASVRPILYPDLGVPGSVFLVVFKTHRVHNIGSHSPPTACMIAFRGAWTGIQKKANDKRGSDMIPEPMPGCDGCYRHPGYWKVWTLLRPLILQKMGEIGCTEGTPLYVAGFSFGAAVAPFAMWELHEKWPVLLSYHIGSPRVGNSYWAEAFKRRFKRKVPLFRIVHGRDTIPRWPARWQGYEHFPYQVWYNKNADGSITHQICNEGESCGNEQYERKDLLYAFHCKMAGFQVPGEELCPSKNCPDHFYQKCWNPTPPSRPPKLRLRFFGY